MTETEEMECTHKEELLDFKHFQHFYLLQTEQFRNSVVTHRLKDINCNSIIYILQNIRPWEGFYLRYVPA